jgi:hypothetical protein
MVKALSLLWNSPLISLELMDLIQFRLRLLAQILFKLFISSNDITSLKKTGQRIFDEYKSLRYCSNHPLLK